MKIKAYLLIITICIACCAINLPSQAIHNQQINLSLSALNTTKSISNSTLTDLETTLHKLGINNYQVVKNSDKEIIIYYYSVLPVEFIKKEIEANLILEKNNRELPIKQSTNNQFKNNYLLQIGKIEQNPNGIEGTLVNNLNLKERKYNSNPIKLICFSLNEIETSFIKYFQFHNHYFYSSFASLPHWSFPISRAGPHTV